MKTILVADDTATGRELVRAVLEPAGYIVLEASDGIEAVQLARDAHPDMILLDLHMPRLDGYGVVRELRQSPEFAALPIVALTASAMQGDRERAMAAGFSDYIAKPIKLAVLRTEIERLLG
jgi:CheY-like chemotaxis protein